MRFSNGFTSDIPLPFSIRSNTFTAVTFQLEPLSIVYTESLQGDDVEPHIKNLLEQAGIWVSRPRCVPGGLEQACNLRDGAVTIWTLYAGLM